MSINVIGKQRECIYNDLMEAAKTLLPIKEQKGCNEYRRQVIMAMKAYADQLKEGEGYQFFCQKWGLDQEAFIGEIFEAAIATIA